MSQIGKVEIDQAEFDQIALTLKTDVAAAAIEGMEKARAKRRRFDDDAMRIINGIPHAVTYAIERMEPAHGEDFEFYLLADCKWKDTYRAGHMAYDTTTSVVMAFCSRAGLKPQRIESENGWCLQLTVKMPQAAYQPRKFGPSTQFQVVSSTPL
jgi:hypothetical protein